MRCFGSRPSIIVRRLPLLGLALLLLAPGTIAETITGFVTAPDGTAVSDVEVTLIELGRTVRVNEKGEFSFQDVAAGSYHLEAASRRLGSSVAELTVDGEDNHVILVLDRSRHRERIVVSATRGGRGSAEAVQPVSVLDEAALSENLQPTLGETLNQEPGISSTYFGAGASRPVIRGQGAGRVKILESGLDVGDASETSPDHAVSTDGLTAERIEILRGPATLLYGSTAVGGVVNVIDERIPERAARKALEGSTNLRFGSAADEKAGALTLHGGAAHFAWYADAQARSTDDYEIPGHAVVGDPNSPSGTLPNSALESNGATFGASWVGGRGFLGASIRGFDTLYGIPIEEGLQIDLEQRRFDLRGGLDTTSGVFDALSLSVGATDYEHRELEDGSIGTRFVNETLDGRVELHHGHATPHDGVIGLQYTDRDFEASGEEAFLPPSETGTLALFALQTIERERLRWEVGGRFEMREVATPVTVAPLPVCAAPRDRDFRGLSGSAGLAWMPGEAFALGFSATFTERMPSAEELYSCGEHAATQSIEIGDPDLDEETSLGFDLSLRKRKGRTTGEITLFSSRYSDYVLAQPADDLDGIFELPAFRYQPIDARFLGAEISGVIELFAEEHRHLDLELFGDWVDAENASSGEALPFMPPMSYGLGMRYTGDRWYASARVTRVDSQARAVMTEFDTDGVLETDGYTMVGATLGYRRVSARLLHDVMLRGRNLTDEDARANTSLLRDLVPMPGRDLGIVYRFVF